MPRLNALYRRYRDRGLVVLGLNADACGERARRLAAREIEYSCLFEAQTVCADYGVVAFPAYLLIDRNGELCAQSGFTLSSTGAREDDLAALEGQLRVLLAASTE